MIKDSYNIYRHVFMLLMLMLVTVGVSALDYTSRVAGAACDDLSYWHITDGVNGALQYTQSTRGSKDGSNMTGQYTQYWISKNSGATLDDAEIRHDEISGLPKGEYRLTLRIRCYDERGINAPDGVFLYANGMETNATSGDGIQVLNYSGQPGTYGVVAVSFEVGDDGTLNFGINVRNYNATWVAWKDVTLECTAMDISSLENMTMTEKLAALANGQITDATFAISNPSFEAMANDNWEGDFTYGNSNNYGCAEAWNKTFNASQTITNLPNGRYQFSVLGFYRYNNQQFNYNYVAYQNKVNNNQVLLAMIYANDQTAPLQDIAEPYAQMESLGYPYGYTNQNSASLPFSMYEARDAFDRGLYTYTNVTCEVTNHELRIGIKKEQLDGQDWTIWDEVKLTLLELGDNSDYNPEDTPQEEVIEWDQASKTNPIDVTSLIVNPDFKKGKNGWEGSPSTNNGTAELYYKTGTVYQQLTNLRNGFYRLHVNGFYRYGDIAWEQRDDYGWHEDNGNNVWAMYTIPYATMMRQQGREHLYAMLFANQEQAPLPSIFDYAHQEATHYNDYETELGWIIQNQQGASEAFAEGEFPVELLVPVTNGQLTIGVKKTGGYKNDWACWSNFRLEYLGTEGLEYVTSIKLDKTTLNMTVGEQMSLNATAQPTTASNTELQYYISNSSGLSVDEHGVVTAKSVGDYYVYINAPGAENNSLWKEIKVSITDGGSPNNLVVNEIQVSNVDMFVDPTFNYGSYIELYNPGTTGVSLTDMYIGFDANEPLKYQYKGVGAVPAKGFGIIWLNQAYDLANYNRPAEKLDMDGGTIYLSDANGNLILTQTYPAAVTRTSYARTSDGGSEWGITADPTPGSTNKGSSEFVAATGYQRLPMPETSVGSQMFQNNVSVTVTIPQGASLRFTTDGTIPTYTSTRSRNGQFSFENTTILRLRLFQTGKLPSPVKTLSFIKRDKDYTLPVLSVVGDPKSFYNDTLGILVPGTNGVSGSGVNFRCNWNQDWERAVAFDYLSASGDSCYSQEAAIKRFGGWSRAWFPYNFKLKSSSLYEGQKYMKHAFFEGKPYLRHKVLQVRNGGNDLLCRIKDASIHQMIMTSGFYLDCMEYQPAHVFFNGEYVGMENLREPSNKHFAYANYGIDTDEMDQMKLAGGIGEVGAGNTEALYLWRDLSYSADDPEVYKQICDMVDVDEFINYMAAELYLGGDDWPDNNCKAFKGNDGKFHIVFFDVDQALRYDAGTLNRFSRYYNSFLPNIFFNMLNNDTFRKQFIDSYCLVGGSVFEPTRCHAIVDEMSAKMDPALALEGLSTQPTAANIKKVITAERREKMMNALQEWYYTHIGENGEVALRTKLSSNVAAAQLTANGLPIPTGRFDGTFFSPMTIQAQAPEGYTFTGWVDENSGRTVSTSVSYTLPTSSSTLQLQARFAHVDASKEMEQLAMPVKVNELSAGNTVYANEYFKRNDWLELYNNTDVELDAAGLYVSDDIDDPMKYQIPTGSTVLNTRIPAGGRLIVWADELQSVSQLHASFKLSNTNGQHVIVASSDQFVANNAAYFEAHPAMRSFVDGMEYDYHPGDQSVGRYPDGGFDFYQMGRPTIEKANTLLTSDVKVGEDHLWAIPEGATNLRINLSKGWNWFSHPLQTAIGVSALSQQVTRVVGKDREAILDSRYGLTGNLRSMDAGQLYKVQLTADDNYRVSNPVWADRYISLLPGWNWIGYSVNGAQPVVEALADSPIEEGDQLVGQDGFATYENGHWTGSLNTFETGKGYMYKSARAKTLRLKMPTVAVNVNKARVANRLRDVYGVDKYAYPNVMGVIATMQLDGQLVSPDRFTLMAFSDDECRGVAKTVADLSFLTLYGHGGEAIHYRALDEETGIVYGVEQKAVFASLIDGTVASPRLLTLTTDVAETTSVQAPAASRAVITGYYSMKGTLMGHRASQLAPGIYVVRYNDGSCRKIKIQ